MVGPAALLQLRKLVIRFRKMHAFEAGPKSRKAVRFEDFLGQGVVNIFRRIRQSGSDNVAKLAAGDSANLLVNRNVPADIKRRGVFAFIEKLELRIEKDELRFVSVEVHAAEQHDLTPGAELARLEICAMKPFGVNKAAAVGQDDVEDAAARPSLDNAAAVDASGHSRILSDFQPRNGNEVGAVLIRLRKMKQQILDRTDVSRGQQTGSPAGASPFLLHNPVPAPHVTCYGPPRAPNFR